MTQFSIFKHQKAKILLGLFVYWIIGLLFPSVVGAALPSSTNYKIQNYSFGAGGTASSSSQNYSMNGVAGEIEFGQPFSANFKVGAGLSYTMMASMSAAPTFTNPSDNYDRLHLIINPGTNPSDYEYALQISTDSDFDPDVRYIKSDNTIGITLTDNDFQTYTEWGGAAGEYITGLEQDTPYYLRVKARQGSYTETGYSPSATATTSVPSLTFGVNSSTITFSNLNAGNTYTDIQSTELKTSTNAFNGYIINARSTGPLTAPGIDSIADYGSDNSSPTAWSATGFGYTTDDSNLVGGTSDRFTNGGSKYAGFTTDTEGDPVADHPGPILTSVVDEIFNIGYRVTTSSNQKAGQYTTTILYIVVPSY